MLTGTDYLTCMILTGAKIAVLWDGNQSLVPENGAKEMDS